MTTNEEQELRNAAKYLRGVEKNTRLKTVGIPVKSWASMLERAADRIETLESYISSQGGLVA